MWGEMETGSHFQMSIGGPAAISAKACRLPDAFTPISRLDDHHVANPKSPRHPPDPDIHPRAVAPAKVAT